MKSIKHSQNKKRKPVLPLRAYLGHLLICTLLLTGVSFARFVTASSNADSARVAAGVVTVGYDGNTYMELIRPWDDGTLTEEFTFSVSNGASEVAIRYDVVVKLSQPLGTGVTMTLDGQPITAVADNTYTFSNVGTFEAGVSETNTHTLSFSGDFMTIPSGTDDIYNIQISIYSQQID